MTRQVEELLDRLNCLSDDELRELATTPEWAYFMHRLYKLRPGQEWTVEAVDMDRQVCLQYPCSTEFYKAQMELNRQRSHQHPGVWR
jgi:hypothetical protein